MKEYGQDLLKKYRELEKKQTSLRNKVIKRFKFLLNNSDDPYLEGFYDDLTDNYSTDMMIFIIIRVENNYTSKSKQLNMFDQNDNKL